MVLSVRRSGRQFGNGEQMTLTDDDSFLDRAAVHIIPPLMPLGTVVLGIGLELLLPIDVGFTLPAGLQYWIGGLIFVGSLLGLALWPVILLRRSGQSEFPWRPTPSIVEKGPFRFTRNPMYLQMVVACIGVAIALMNVWILVLTPVCAWFLQQLAILPEEAYLERKFGDEYRAYKSRVRRWI